MALQQVFQPAKLCAMATTRSPAKRAPGRPRKAPQDRLEQFSIRLPPKLKLGLELLARGQHRSMSQAVEWALNAGLSKFELRNDSYYSSLAAMLDDVWEFSPAKRAITMLLHAPELMTFEERTAAELVEHSIEMQAVQRGDKTAMTPESFDQLVEGRWDSILKLAERIISNGESPKGHSLVALERFG